MWHYWCAWFASNWQNWSKQLLNSLRPCDASKHARWVQGLAICLPLHPFPWSETREANWRCTKYEGAPQCRPKTLSKLACCRTFPSYIFIPFQSIWCFWANIEDPTKHFWVMSPDVACSLWSSRTASELTSHRRPRRFGLLGLDIRKPAADPRKKPGARPRPPHGMSCSLFSGMWEVSTGLTCFIHF
jgi:hypothetical protein